MPTSPAKRRLLLDGDAVHRLPPPPRLIGVIHLPPLPGAPRWGSTPGNDDDKRRVATEDDEFDRLLTRAAADARAYAENGADAVIVENFGDAPFTKGAVGPETVAAMAAAGRAVRAVLLADAGTAAANCVLGFNVLRNDGRAALALCAACGGGFVRVNVLSGAAWTDQGLIEGDAHGLLRYRRTVCPGALIFADVHVKHARPAPGVGALPIEEAARDTLERGLADALIVTGPGTGAPTDPADVARVRAACGPEARIFVGSGTTPESVGALRAAGADGFIVGSSLMRDGRPGGPVEGARVAALVRALHASV